MAFSESYEDEKLRTESEFAKELEVRGQPAEWFVLGAFNESNELIGFVKFRRDVRSKARHKSMIHAMYTDPKVRGQKVGKKLIEELEVRAKKLVGLEQIHLWVLHAETSASEFYEKCGYQRQGPYVNKDLKIDGKYVDAEYMVKYLD